MAGINYNLGLQNRQFLGGIQNSMSGIRGMAGSFARIAAPVAALAGSFIGLRASVNGIKSAFDLGGSLSDLSARTGATVSDLVLLQQAFRDNGIGAEQVGIQINRMQRALAGVSEDGQSTSKVFNRLGLDMGSVRKMGAAEQLDTIGRAIRSIGDPAERAAAAMGIFGRSGGEMLTLFADAGALGNAGKTLGGQAALLEKNSATFDRISDLLKSSGQKFSGFFVGVADQIAPVILPLLESFNNIDFSGFGQKVGEAFSMIAAAFSSGQLINIISSSMKIAFMESINFLWKSFRATISAAGQYIIELFRTAVTYFEVLTTADFWKGMGNAIVGVFLSAVGFLQKGLAEALEIARPLAELFGKSAGIDSAQSTLRDSAGILDAEAAAKFGDASDQLGPLAEKIGQRWKEAGENIADRFQEQFAKTADVLDPTGARQSLDKAFGDVRAVMEENRKAAEKAKEALAGATPTPTDPQAPAAAGAARAARQVQADRLRQIGGYVGGGLAASKDRFAERTEQWTRKSSEALTKLVDMTRNPRPQTSGAALF